MARLKAIPWTRCCVDCAGGRVVRREERRQISEDGSNLTMSSY
jgi:RNA polymerase-binding transcription factor DksA